MSDWQHVDTHTAGTGKVTVTYDVRAWRVTFTASPGRPFDGPEELHVFLTNVAAVESAIESDGLTTDLLRVLPLADARKRIRALQPPEPFDIPAKVETDAEYARFAAAYVDAVRAGKRRPIERLQAATGVSRNTLSARVRRARERGFLTGQPGQPADQLTDKATRLLDQ